MGKHGFFFTFFIKYYAFEASGEKWGYQFQTCIFSEHFEKVFSFWHTHGRHCGKIISEFQAIQRVLCAVINDSMRTKLRAFQINHPCIYRVSNKYDDKLREMVCRLGVEILILFWNIDIFIKINRAFWGWPPKLRK